MGIGVKMFHFVVRGARFSQVSEVVIFGPFCKFTHTAPPARISFSRINGSYMCIRLNDHGLSPNYILGHHERASSHK